MVSYGNKYPRHNARPHVVEQSGQCARALSATAYLMLDFVAAVARAAAVDLGVNDVFFRGEV